MAVVHRVRLIEPGFDRISPVLCFLSDDARPTALGDKYPRVVNLKTRIIDAPTDFPARLEGIHRASDGKTERLPTEADTLGELGLAAFDANVGRVRIPARPLRSVDQV
jgi:hypothetical protein